MDTLFLFITARDIGIFFFCFAFFSPLTYFSFSLHRLLLQSLSLFFLFGKLLPVYRKREKEKITIESIYSCCACAEHAFKLRLAYASWKARCKPAMKRKYRDNSIDTSPSTSSESSTTVVSCSSYTKFLIFFSRVIYA